MSVRIGARLLRVRTPDGKDLYFTITRFFSFLRLLWIFRNFSSLNDRVLSERQVELIRRICRSEVEAHPHRVSAEALIATLELTANSSNRNWAARPQHILAESNDDRPRRHRLAFALNITAVFLLFAGIVLSGQQARQQLRALVSKPSAALMKIQRREPAIRNAGSTDGEGHAPQTTVQAPSNAAGTTFIASSVNRWPSGERLAALDVAPELKLTRASAGPSRNREPQLDMNELLPPSGPPQSRPTPDFTAVSNDTAVVLQAIVSPDGRVKRVAIVEGNAKLAREAALAVASWRYGRRSDSGDAESWITFRFYAPDVISVSFLPRQNGLR
jgi:hypothetical protein